MGSIELQQLLADMKENFQNFKCTLQDLRNPTEEFVTNFYSYWLQEFEVDINQIVQNQFTQLAVIEPHQDAYSGIIPKVNLLKSIRAFDVVPDFGILDIISPTPKRIQMILRCFINFYSWADARAASVMVKKRILIDRKVKLSNKIKEREELKDQLNSTTINIGQIVDSKTQLEKEVVLLQQEYSDLVMEKQIQKTNSDELSVVFREKENVLQKINKEESLVSSKIKDFSTLVVDSPSSILSELQNLRSKNEEMTELSEQKRNMVESKMKAHNKLQKGLENQQQRTLQLNEILKLIDQYRELAETVSSTEKNTNACQEQLEELKSLLLTKSSQKQSRQEALQSLYLKWTALKPQLAESLESALRDLTDKKKGKHKMINYLKEDATVQESINALLKKIETHVQDVLSDYEALQKQENDYLDSLNESTLADTEKTVKVVEERMKQWKKFG